MKVAAAVTPFALLATSCGGPNNAVSRAVNKTEAAGSYHVVLTVRLAGDARVHQIYAGDVGSGVAEYRMESWRQISDGMTLYMTSSQPRLRKQLKIPAGMTWATVNLFALSRLTDYGFDGTSMFTDAGRLASARDLHRVAAEPGAYEGTVPASEGTIVVSGTNPTSGRSKLRTQVEVWLSRDGYLSRIKTLVGKPTFQTTVVYNLSQVGVPVKISVPMPVFAVDRTDLYLKLFPGTEASK